MSTPLRILSLGAGVQSTTVLLLAIHGEIAPVDAAIFADTGAEPRAVYKHLEWLEGEAQRAGVPVHHVSAGNLADDMVSPDNRWKSGHPPLFMTGDAGHGTVQRQCTERYKIVPIRKKLRELVGIGALARPRVTLVEQVLGISLDEAIRMRDADFAWIRNAYPLVDLRMTRGDCLNWLAHHGYPRPVKSSCVFCPYRRNDEFREVRDASPEDWTLAVRVDAALRRLPGMTGEAFVHRQRVPLPLVDLRSRKERGQRLLDFEDECAGVCGV